MVDSEVAAQFPKEGSDEFFSPTFTKFLPPENQRAYIPLRELLEISEGEGDGGYVPEKYLLEGRLFFFVRYRDTSSYIGEVIYPARRMGTNAPFVPDKFHLQLFTNDTWGDSIIVSGSIEGGRVVSVTGTTGGQTSSPSAAGLAIQPDAYVVYRKEVDLGVLNRRAV